MVVLLCDGREVVVCYQLSYKVEGLNREGERGRGGGGGMERGSRRGEGWRGGAGGVREG